MRPLKRMTALALLTALPIVCQPDCRTQILTAGPPHSVVGGGVERVAPGTVIPDGPPQGWSHLIVKSQPRLDPAAVPRVNAVTARLAGFLFTVFVANVEGSPGSYRLDRVAMGVGTRVDGRDVVLTAESAGQFARLGPFERIILGKADERQADMRVIARSADFALIDSPVWTVRVDRHRLTVFRYALLVDAVTGRLDALVWIIDRDESGSYLKAVGPIQWLAPSTREDAILHLDEREFTLGWPTEAAFAVEGPPRGEKQLPLPASLREQAGLAALTPHQAADLEKGLRHLRGATR